MPDRFYDGQRGPDIRRELNNLEAVFDDAIANAKGPQGWAPVVAVVTDGARSVLRITDWTGGEGSKPAVTGFIGATGIVATAALAVDIRGSIGATGPANSLSIGTVTEGVAAATITGTAPSQTLNLVLPKATDGADGTHGDDGWSPIFAVVADGERRVLQLVDWAGGTGAKPGTGAYVGSTGLVALVADATDIRGAEGAAGSGSGDVVGPAASVDNEVALFDGATGKAIKGGGVLNTGAYSEEDRWKLQSFFVDAVSPESGAPAWTLGSYYPLSQTLVANGHIVIKALNGDIYTMTDGAWVLTNPFNANLNGVRIAYAKNGDLGPFLWTRIAGVTTRTSMQQGSGNIRYSEGTGGFDFATYTVRQKLDQIGRLIDLTTTDKTNIVAAINELVSSKSDASVLGTAASYDVPATGNATTGEVVKGDDTRLSDSRPPTGSAGGVLSGSYPNPGFAVDMATQAELDAVSSVANSKLSDAPSDGKTYGRKDAAWVEVAGGGAVRMVQEVLTSGTSWTAPANLVGGRVKYRMSGGGGSASYVGVVTSSAAGAGGYCEGQAIVTAASTYTYAIGAGGPATTSTGNAGGATSIFGATAYGAPGASTANPSTGVLNPGGSWSGGQFGMNGGSGFTMGTDSASYSSQSGANPLGTPAMANYRISTGSSGYGSGGALNGEAGKPGVIILEYLVSI